VLFQSDPSEEALDFPLQPGQDRAMAAAAGTELFCASGLVRVRWPGACLPSRLLPAGQSLRVPTSCVLLVTALAPSRCRWSQAPGAATVAAAAAEAGRSRGRLWWGRRSPT
jgi:hypothetical protein